MLTLDCNIKDDTFKLILTDIHKTAKPTFSNKPLNLFHDSLTRNKNNNTNTNIKNVFFFFSHRQQTSETSLAGLELDGCQALRMLEHEADMLSLCLGYQVGPAQNATMWLIPARKR